MFLTSSLVLGNKVLHVKASMCYDRHKMTGDDLKRVQDGFKSGQGSRRWFQDVIRHGGVVPFVP